MQTLNTQGEWINILSKGIITIPKKMRERVGIKEGDIARIRVLKNTLVIEPRGKTDYRIFTDKQAKEWEKEDKLSAKHIKKIDILWPELP